ncbi:MAG: DUF2062 domain-containing protein [Ignavibacteriae bacterium]|nr:DUF2062 domain-containing protein [Ignavibacteriota bacterium]
MKQIIKNYINSIFNIEVEPKNIAFSLALGVFVGITVPMGFETISVIPLCLLFRANIYLAAGATLISNPFTILPLYYVTFNIGSIFTNQELNWNEIRYLIDSPSYSDILELGGNLLLTLALGNFIFAIILSSITYFTFFYLVKFYKEKKLTSTIKKDLL